MKMDAREKEKLFKEKERQMENERQKTEAEWQEKWSGMEAEKERKENEWNERLRLLEAERDGLKEALAATEEEGTRVKAEREEEAAR